ncbi:4277_t:CDS:1 [Acaulospora morrowiae]|uniref:4277_t:CDS:1 n=1 Tax=Acaulospora morrowiae TaxID=94023 RepID=A0A9N8V687_9GLOM|nr:4277_t:CDS:1 [Acaulospora morrowiae]
MELDNFSQETTLSQDSATISSTSSTYSASTKKKPKSKTSKVSPYFIQSTTNNNRVMCILCDHNQRKTYSKTTSTGILCKHLNSQHPGWNTNNELSNQYITISMQELTLTQKTQFNMLITEWIVSDTLPFSVITSKLLSTVFQYLNGTISLPSRETIKSNVHNAFDRMQKDVQILLEQISSKISITLDIWTSQANISFLCVTAHWIDDNWKLNKILLDISVLSHPHTGKDINICLRKVFTTFNIMTKIFGITFDNGSNIISAIQLLDEYLSGQSIDIQPFQCLAHILNLIITTGLSPIKNSIEKVCNFVRTIGSSALLTQDFQELGQTIGKNEPVRKIPQDISIRWNSTYLMLSVYITMPTTIAAIIRQHSNLSKYQLTVQENANLQVITQFLRPFYETTNTLSGSKYAILSLSILLINDIMEIILTQINDPTTPTFLKNTAIQMSKKAQKYMNQIYSEISFIASVLDPRIKLELISNDINTTENQKLFNDILEIKYSTTSYQTNMNMQTQTNLIYVEQVAQK